MDALAILKEVSRRDEINGRIVEALEEAARLVGDSADALDEMLVRSCLDAPAGIFEPCRGIIEAGGKRVRPMLCLLSFRSAGGVEPLPMDLAIACELLHNATLLHDDVIDEGEVRRGRPATRVIHGNAISVLAGDYLLVRCVEMVSKRGPQYMNFFLKTMREIIGGELIQLQHRGSTRTTEKEYFQIIEGKTASLFRWAAYSGALATGSDEEISKRLGLFGWHTGVAFQLVDDVLDFTADASHLGKSLLADIREGKMTLPVILAGRVSKSLGALLQKLSRGGDPAAIAPRVADLVAETEAIEKTRRIAGEHTDLAIEAIEGLSQLDGEIVAALKELTTALLERKT
jgi:octaprenyl-diphosphate synthase